jgi:uncharacterized damage-inducible protein DinB
MGNTVAAEFVAQSVFRMQENTPRIEKCLQLLSEEDVWKKPNEAGNSIGNLILHLCGNITQYIISSLGNKEDNRVRDEEFSVKGGYTKEQLFKKLTATVAEAVGIIQSLDENELMCIRSVQGFQLSAIGSILHVAEHYSYHAGQIALITKLITNKDLGFYAGYDLNKKNKS